MTISSLSRVLVRRWYVTVLGILFTLLLGVAAFTKVQPNYSASASVLLLPPQSTKGENPLMNLGAVPGVTGVLSRNMVDSSIADRFAAEGVAKYSVTPDQTAGGPIVVVTGKGSTAEEALHSMRVVMTQVDPTLMRMQVDLQVPKASLITTKTIQVDTKATVLRKSQTRAVIAAIAIGLLLTLVAAALADSAIGRWQRRRTAAREARHRETLDQPASQPDFSDLMTGPRHVSERASRQPPAQATARLDTPDDERRPGMFFRAQRQPALVPPEHDDRSDG
jgi:hypothetical protein